MRNLILPPQGGTPEQWVKDCLSEIENEAVNEAGAAIAEFATTGTLTERRTINAGTATLAELRDFVSTLVNDVKKQGQKRTYAD